MKARLIPVYFKSARDNEFDEQVKVLKTLLSDEADILDSVPLGAQLPQGDAVVFPQLVGEAYRRIDEIKKINMPVIAITSEFGTVAMWDWEIVTFFKCHGIKTFAPYNLDLTKAICRALSVRRGMQGAKFLIFQDNPGDGMQASIFKRFYWWEDECTNLIKDRFGISIVKKSLKKLGQDEKNIPDDEAEKVLRDWSTRLNVEGVSKRALNSAVKLYIALKREIEAEGGVSGIGMNCLNESFYLDTTPCLAWDMLYEDMGLMWACEGDTMSLLTKYIIHNSLNAPIMMSNVYPILVGMAALKHERIDRFPEVEDPDNCLLAVHCGYFGFVPRPFCTQWTLRTKALKIVDENATVVDARMPEGDVTLAKLHPRLNKIQVMEGSLEKYVQYPGSDCRNGALIRVKDGHRLMDELYSHHNCIMTGHRAAEIKFMAKVLDIEVEDI